MRPRAVPAPELGHVIPSVKLAADRSGLVRGGVQVQVEIRWMVEHSVDLVSAGMNAVGNGVVISIEMLVVEEINPMPTVVMTRRVVEMEGGHRPIEPVPGDVVAHSLQFSVKIEAGDTSPVMVSTIFQLVSIKLYKELLMAVVVGSGHLMR